MFVLSPCASIKYIQMIFIHHTSILKIAGLWLCMVRVGVHEVPAGLQPRLQAPPYLYYRSGLLLVYVLASWKANSNVQEVILKVWNR